MKKRYVICLLGTIGSCSLQGYSEDNAIVPRKRGRRSVPLSRTLGDTNPETVGRFEFSNSTANYAAPEIIRRSRDPERRIGSRPQAITRLLPSSDQTKLLRPRNKIFEYVRNGNIDTLERYLRNSGNPNEVSGKERCSRSLAMIAATYGHVGMLELLKDYRSDLWQSNKSGDTTLSLAARNGQESVVKYLLENKIIFTPKEKAHAMLQAREYDQPACEYLLMRDVEAKSNQLARYSPN